MFAGFCGEDLRIVIFFIDARVGDTLAIWKVSPKLQRCDDSGSIVSIELLERIQSGHVAIPIPIPLE